MYCPKCGNQIEENAKFCNICGMPTEHSGQSETSGAASAEQPSPSVMTKSIPVSSTVSAAATAQSVSDPHQSPSRTKPGKNGSGKVLPAIIGGAVLVIALVVALVFFVMSGTSSSEADKQESTETRQTTSESTEANTEGENIEYEVSAATPTFGTPTASSVLMNDVEPHNPFYAVDEDTTTAWTEGVPGSGEGSWLEFNATSFQSVHAISIMGGFCKAESLYYKNCRPKEVTISFDDGSQTTQTLKDEPFAWQTITLGEAVQTKTVKITINSIYQGSVYDDLCISEIVIQ